MNNKSMLIYLLAFIVLTLVTSCGESSINLGPETFEQKIVIQGFIFPGNKVESIRLTKNFPLNTTPNPAVLVISNADVKLTDMETGKEYKLTFNLKKLSYEYSGSDLTIGFDKYYKLTVNTNIDGKIYSASSITKTPKQGFSIDQNKSVSGIIRYRELDKNGNVKELPIVVNLSEGTSYYPISIVALQASDSTFIYDNAYREVKKEDVIKNLDNFKYQKRWMQNLNPLGTSAKYEINWLGIWFYSLYRVIVYAGDENFRLYSQTNSNVQEFDGNFHEPRINIQGDGIGVFASAIADTINFTVKK